MDAAEIPRRISSSEDEDDAFGSYGSDDVAEVTDEIANQLIEPEEDYEALANRKRKALKFHAEMLSKKLRKEDITGENIDREALDAFYFGLLRKSKKVKKKGRPKGSKNKVSPEITRKLGDATLCYASGDYAAAISLLHEIIRLSPCTADAFHMLGLVHDALGDKTRAFSCYELASKFMPKDSHIWKVLVTWSLEQGKTTYAWNFLSNAIDADPKDVSLRIIRASLYTTIGDYMSAAEAYEEIARLWPENVDALKSATMLYNKCDQRDRSILILEAYLENQSSEIDLSIIDLLATVLMEGNDHIKALQHIERAQEVYCARMDFPLCLTFKAGICHVHLGHMDEAEVIFSHLEGKSLSDQRHLIIGAVDSLMKYGHYDSAFKCCMMLEGNGDKNNGYLCARVATCLLNMKENLRAIEYIYKALPTLDDSGDSRLILSSLLLDKDRMDEAIAVLCPPAYAVMSHQQILVNTLEAAMDPDLNGIKPWWLDTRIKLKLAHIYKTKGMLEAFVDVLFPLVHDSLLLVQKKVRVKKRLSRCTLLERVKILEDPQTSNLFRGLRPLASKSDRLKGSRARKLLEKKALQKEGRKSSALTAGLDCGNGSSDDEVHCLNQNTSEDPPLPNLLKDVEHHLLILDLCKQLVSLHRYSEALEIIILTLRSASNVISPDKKEELRIMGAQIAYINPVRGWDLARYIVLQNPYSFTAWNCYYKVMSRLFSKYPRHKMDNRFSKHFKFLHHMRDKYKDCVPAMVISGHQLTLISQHQAAAREYLGAYKLMPENPLINLCVGTALINLALGLRIQNKPQCLVQGLAFLHNSRQISQNNQETLYNVARAYHHIGLISLAAIYYEKALAIYVNDYTIPELPKENQSALDSQKIGHCDLQREAAYNLHLIYRKSGAFDLARQVLKDHCAL